MYYKDINTKIWDSLNSKGNYLTGYHGIWLENKIGKKTDIYIFKDEKSNYHFAIKGTHSNNSILKRFSLNGLDIELKKFKIGQTEPTQYIDLSCSLSGYLKEFTEVIKEISLKIIDQNIDEVEAVNTTIQNWISFWKTNYRETLSEESQIGLIAELLMLKELCKINPDNAINSWKGPTGEKNDFVFSEWNLEIKGTRSKRQIIKINGIDQLKPDNDKNLGLVLFSFSKSTNNQASLNLTKIIREIRNAFIDGGKVYLVSQFNTLLAQCGYSPIHASKYNEFNIELNGVQFFNIDSDFPKLTSDMLKKPLSQRIISLGYETSLIDMKGIPLTEIKLGEIFY